jgi:outer membrane protein TolC
MGFSGWKRMQGLAGLVSLAIAGCSTAAGPWLVVMPEQRSLEIRDPADLPRARVPDTRRPATVSDRKADAPPQDLSLDDAIRIALENSAVVRVLAGVSVAASGRTIYDAAISNTAIDEQKARFDPTVQVKNNFNRAELPGAVFDPADPRGARITGSRTDSYDLNVGVSKSTITGGTAALNLDNALSRFQPGVAPLNPQDRSALDLSLTQPLLQGAGIAANLAPIVVARIDTERSYFQFKDSVQELVRGVIEAYWNVVFARTDAWARRQQVEQGQAAYDRADARQRQGFASAAEVAQARLARSNFQAGLITAEANLLEREAALRNILGLPPSEPERFVPVTPPSQDRLSLDWEKILTLAEERRSDLIELKLVIEADEQLLLQARNQALPRVDAVALYRWNGLEGETPSGASISTAPGQFADWTLGVNFSVPIGLRQSRAGLRRQELIIERDRANLDQGMHNATHALAGSTRNLDRFYEQYEAFRQTRAAARLNLDQQLAEFRAGRTIFINVLQAITDWGNAVSSEAQSLTQYNTELANLERQTGTILESHGITFYEERYGSIGPLGRLHPRCYPSRVVPAADGSRYPTTHEPAEQRFDLETPAKPSTGESKPSAALVPTLLPPE